MNTLDLPYRASLKRKLVTLLLAGLFTCTIHYNLSAGLLEEETSSKSIRLPLHLHSDAKVDPSGVFLDQIMSSADPSQKLPHIRLFDTPQFNDPITFGRQQISNALARMKHHLAFAPMAGAETVAVERRSRLLSERELGNLLINELQADYAEEGAQIEIEFNRPWEPVRVPDEIFDIRISNLPSSGLAPYLIVRFDLTSGDETIGRWQVSLRIQVMKEIWVSNGPIARGSLISQYDFKKERKDILRIRDTLDLKFDENTPDFEAAQGIAKGTPVTNRHLKLRPLVKKGDLVEALVRNGSIRVNMKAEALENGINGQIIRLRNPHTRQYLRGRVTGDQTVTIAL